MNPNLSPDFFIAELVIDDNLRPKWDDSCQQLRIPVRNNLNGRHPMDGMTLSVCSEKNGPVLLLKGEEGSTFYPDTKRVISDILLERYCEFKRPFISRLPFNYRIFPLFLRYFLAVRMLSKRTIPSDAFPSFPVERSLVALIYALGQAKEDLRDFKINKEWPERRRYCVILTHDLEERISLQEIRGITDIEREYGVRSCWFITGTLYSSGHSVLEYLVDEGFELGLHGYSHDGRLPYIKPYKIRDRFNRCLPLIERYHIKGFRSPNYYRNPTLFNEVARYFTYDSTVPDVDIFSPGTFRGGSCTIFPYSIDGLLELPVTLPFDVPFLAGYPADRLMDFWKEKIEWIRDAGGLLLVNVHPYPYCKAKSPLLFAYRRLLDYLSRDDVVWKAMPAEVSGIYRKG